MTDGAPVMEVASGESIDRLTAPSLALGYEPVGLGLDLLEDEIRGRWQEPEPG